MSGLLSSDVWLLVILAVVLAAWIVVSKSSSATAKLAAFFTVLGDVLILLALWGGNAQENSVSS